MEIEIQTKVCRKCGYEKSVDMFGKMTSSKDGLQVWCKECINGYQKGMHRAKGNDKKKRRGKKKVHITPRVSTLMKSNRCPPVRKHKEQKPRMTDEICEKSKTKALNFYQKCFLNSYETLLSYGLSQQTIQDVFGCSRSGIDSYTIYEKQGEEAYQRGMAKLQAMLCSQIVIRSMGYEYQEEKIIYTKAIDSETRKQKWVEMRKEVYKKHQPSNAELMVFLMTNRFPDKWKVSKELLTGKVEGYDDNPSQRNRKIIESQAAGILAEDTEKPKAELPVQG